jgi:catechol 2,3-dioxygenase-like lactoylglutathione lyase family enzyme
MRVRLELFVEDMETSIGFYSRVPGFEVARNEPGDVVLGIGPISIDDRSHPRFLYGLRGTPAVIALDGRPWSLRRLLGMPN